MNLGVVPLADRPGEKAGVPALTVLSAGEAGRCTLRPVPSVAKKRKFHLSLAPDDRSTAATATAPEAPARAGIKEQAAYREGAFLPPLYIEAMRRPEKQGVFSGTLQGFPPIGAKGAYGIQAEKRQVPYRP